MRLFSPLINIESLNFTSVKNNSLSMIIKQPRIVSEASSVLWGFSELNNFLEFIAYQELEKNPKSLHGNSISRKTFFSSEQKTLKQIIFTASQFSDSFMPLSFHLLCWILLLPAFQFFPLLSTNMFLIPFFLKSVFSYSTIAL